jgi:hypothetical protein
MVKRIIKIISKIVLREIMKSHTHVHIYIYIYIYIHTHRDSKLVIH